MGKYARIEAGIKNARKVKKVSAKELDGSVWYDQRGRMWEVEKIKGKYVANGYGGGLANTVASKLISELRKDGFKLFEKGGKK